jgi:hypothetical protein
MRTQMATMVYANRVPIDIMSISCCRSKIVAIIPAKTTPQHSFYLLNYAVLFLHAAIVTWEQLPVPTTFQYTVFVIERMVTDYILYDIK